MEGAVTLKLSKASEGKLNAALQVWAKRAEINKPEVLLQAGHVGADFCKIKCPVDTNRLRVSIGSLDPGKEGIFELTPIGMQFGTSVSYAIDVELGHKTRLKKPTPGKKSYVKGQHYMLRGVQAAVPSMVGILSGVLD